MSQPRPGTGGSTDIAAEIEASSAKSNPVNNDKIGIVDSESGNILKKITLTTLKSFLKTYFDGLYNNFTYTLPVATTTVIGGVKRNTGSAGQFVTGFDSSGNITYGTPAGGGASISRPKEIYVTTDGHDASAEVGNPAKPFQTVASAIAIGEATNQPYVVCLGQGQFSVTGLLPSGGGRKGWIGVGKSTELGIINNDTYGGGTISVSEIVSNLSFEAYTVGYSAVSEEEVATNGGSITVEGFGWIKGLAANGGNAYNTGGFSGPGGGAGGLISIKDSFIVSESITNPTGSDQSGNPATTGGDFTADGCDLRGCASISTGLITLGRCSYILSTITENGVPGVITNDKGGNALW